MTKKITILSLLIMLAAPRITWSQVDFVDFATERMIDSLLAHMTLDEKVGQMTLFTSDWDVTGPTLRPGYRDDVRAGRVGAIFNAHTADYNRELQRMAVEETRLGIPLLFGYDVIHGYRTIFPMPLGEAASWDSVAVENAARIAGTEAAAAGLHWTFAPMVDIARDPRWGRIMEGSGEDTYLGSVLARARVRGFQGDDLGDPLTVLACAKHYAAYGAAQAGRDYHTVDMSERVLRDVYLPPFRAAHDAGVATYMTSFNELDGVPASANEHLLRDILREEWGFRGFVVTDYTSINEMVPHGYARDDAHAGLLAAQAGVDMDMQGDVYHRFLADQVRSGQISEMVVNEAVRNILRMKAALGLFDDPYRYSDTERQERYVFSDEHRAAARDMARRSFVLLKNEAEALPLSAGDLSRLAVIGPLADSQADMLGAWHADGQASECVTLLTGLRERLGRGVRVDYARGCSATDDNDADIAAALRVARRADVIVLAVGEPAWMSGEAASRSELDLPGKQEELVAALSALGKPLVVVLFNGRPLAIPGVIDAADAVLEAWYPGTEAGRAVTDVLFGDYNPAGKLPVTFPRSVGQVPIFYAAKNTGRPMDPNNKYTSKYLDVPNTPLFPFGYGLSYTSFTFSELAVDKTSFAPHESVRVSVTVTNTGDRAGEEVVQLYVRDLVGSATRPLRELKAFSKVELAPGASTRLTFTLDVNDLAFYTQSGEWAAEPGDFEVFVGGSSEADLSTTFTLTE